MPKKRKTRKEKILNDKKSRVVPESTSPIASSPQNETQQQKQEPVSAGMTFSLPQIKNETSKVPQKTKQSSGTITVSTSDYGYLSNDLMRTALLTGAIVFAELIIKLFIVRG